MAAQLTRRDREFARNVLKLVVDGEDPRHLYDAMVHDANGDDVELITWAAEDADAAKEDRAESFKLAARFAFGRAT